MEETTSIELFKKEREKLKKIQEQLTKSRKSRPVSVAVALREIFNLVGLHKMWGELK